MLLFDDKFRMEFNLLTSDKKIVLLIFILLFILIVS